MKVSFELSLALDPGFEPRTCSAAGSGITPPGHSFIVVDLICGLEKPVYKL